jgi:uncharacterized protein (DUF433 family)
MDGIVSTDDVMGGEPRLEGRRVSVRQIVELGIDSGMAPSEIADQLAIPVGDVHLALAYYYQNTEKIARVRDRHRKQMEEAREQSLKPPETTTG